MKTMFVISLAAVLIGGLIIKDISSSERTEANEIETTVTVSSDYDNYDLTGWSDASKMAVVMMKEEYGEPTSVTSEMMMWENTGQWKRTVVYAKEYEHNFPLPHVDVMQQWIDYEVPADKFSELAEYDGSVVVNRTNGEISARCDLEGANFLAINIAHDVIEGTKDAQAARDHYAKMIKDMLNGEEPSYMQELQFDVASGNTAYTDEQHPDITQEDIMKMEQMKERMKRELLVKIEN